MDLVIGIGWPGSGQRLLLGMMQHYFQGHPSCFSMPAGSGERNDAPPISGNTPSAAEAHFVLKQGPALNQEQIAGRKYLIQHRSFISWVMSAYDRALEQKGGQADSATDFASFASQQFTGYRAFMDRWVQSDFATMQLLLSYEQLIVYPLESLRLAVRWIDPDSQVDEARLSAAVTAVDLRDCPDPVAYRHYDTSLFAQIDRLCLTREQVRETCLALLGREPAEKSYLPFQCFGSADAMRAALCASEEYRLRQGGLAPERDSDMTSRNKAMPQTGTA